MGARTQTTRRRRKGGRRKTARRSRLPVWATVLAVILVLGGAVAVWQATSGGNKVAASRSEDPATLLPLAQGGPPLRAGHNPARIPSTPPTPAPVPESTPGPRLDLPTRSHDFGRISRRGNVSHVFAVQNVGTANLVVSNLVTSCGCTTAELSSSVIPPGHRADLRVTFDPDYHEVRGNVVRAVWFATNDPAHPWVELRITADVGG